MKNFTLIIALFFSATTFSQPKITGTVKDDLGPLAGATVMLKYTDVGVVTNFDGSFELEALPTDVLSVSYLGYHSKDISIRNVSSFDIVLDGNIGLDEVVVYAYEITDGSCKTICTFCSIFCCSAEGVEIATLEKQSDFNQKLFPNPSSDGKYQLALNENYDTIDLLVTTMTGQRIKTEKSHKLEGNLKIDLSGMPSGIYLINITADGKHLKTQKAIRR